MTEHEIIMADQIEHLSNLLTKIADMVYDEDCSDHEKIKQISYILDEEF